jgi:hypothetical protein
MLQIPGLYGEEAETNVKQAIERELSPKLSTENALKDKV